MVGDLKAFPTLAFAFAYLKLEVNIFNPLSKPTPKNEINL
jgi:hypothetical protein